MLQTGIFVLQNIQYTDYGSLELIQLYSYLFECYDTELRW